MSTDPTLFGLPVDTAEMVAVLKAHTKLAQTLGACGFAVCLWDNLAYLHQEYRLVWQSKWTPLKAAYLYTRYITIVAGIVYFVGFFATWDQGGCNKYVKAMPVIGILPLLGATSVLLTRAYNLWDNNKAILVFMLFLTVIQGAIQIAIGISQTQSIALYPGYVSSCCPTSSSTLYILYWIAPALVHAFIMIFTMVRAWEVLTVKNPHATGGQKLWAIVVTRYGQIFPMLMIVIEIFQIIYYVAVNGTLKVISASLSTFLISVLACQMVLTMRLTTKAGLEGTSLGSTNGTGGTGSGSHPHALGSNIGKLTGPGGIQAFVTSHHQVEKEEELDFERQNSQISGNKGAGEYMPTAHYSAARRQSGIVVETRRVALPGNDNGKNEDEIVLDEKEKDSYIDTESAPDEDRSVGRTRGAVANQRW